MATSTDSACLFKFGPEWIRTLSQPSGGQSPQANPIMPRKFPLSRYRYGKEELLAIYEETIYGDTAPVFDCPNFATREGIFVEKSQVPRSVIPMTEEEHRHWIFHRTAPSRGRGRGLATTPWAPTRPLGSAPTTASRSWRSPEKPNPGFDSWRKSNDDKVPEWADEKIHEENENVGTFDGKGSFLATDPRKSESSGNSFMQRSLSNLENGRREQHPPIIRDNSPLVDKIVPAVDMSPMRKPTMPISPSGPIYATNQKNGLLQSVNSTLREEQPSHVVSGTQNPVGSPMAMLNFASDIPPKEKSIQDFHLPGMANAVPADAKRNVTGGQWNTGRDLAQASLWYYKDPRGIIQGPFTSSDMLDWCSQGYFPNDLECCRAIDAVFNPLGLLIKAWNGELPFFSPSRLPPFATPLTASPTNQNPAKVPLPFNTTNGMEMNPLNHLLGGLLPGGGLSAPGCPVPELLQSKPRDPFYEERTKSYPVIPNNEAFVQPMVSKASTEATILSTQTLPQELEQTAHKLHEPFSRLLDDGAPSHRQGSRTLDLSDHSTGSFGDDSVEATDEQHEKSLKESFHIESQQNERIKTPESDDWLQRNNERNVESFTESPISKSVEEKLVEAASKKQKQFDNKDEKFEKVERKEKKKKDKKSKESNARNEDEVKSAPSPKKIETPAEYDEWGDELISYKEPQDVLVPAPAPTVSAWGNQTENTTSQSLSLHEIQRLEEERVRTEMQKRKREAVRNGHQSGSRTWANAIAPTKSFDQIQQEQQAAKSQVSSHQSKVMPSGPITAANIVANCNTSNAVLKSTVSKSSSKNSSSLGVGNHLINNNNSSSIHNHNENNNDLSKSIQEVSNNEQVLIDWCAQITKGINSYLDMPTVVSILKDVESEAEIEDYISQFFGDKIKEPKQFARQFMQKRSKLNVGSASTQPKQSEWCTTGGNKKKKSTNGRK